MDFKHNFGLSHGNGKIMKKIIRNPMKKGHELGIEPIKFKKSKVSEKPPLPKLQVGFLCLGSITKEKIQDPIDHKVGMEHIKIERSKVPQRPPLPQLEVGKKTQHPMSVVKKDHELGIEPMRFENSKVQKKPPLSKLQVGSIRRGCKRFSVIYEDEEEEEEAETVKRRRTDQDHLPQLQSSAFPHSEKEETGKKNSSSPAIVCCSIPDSHKEEERGEKNRSSPAIVCSFSDSHKEEEETMWELVGGLGFEVSIDRINKWKEEEIALEVEKFMGGLELAAKIDVELMKEARPGFNKIKLLPRLARLVLTRECKQLQEHFLSRGILGLLKSWIGDRSFPKIIIRTGIMKMLLKMDIADTNKLFQEKMRESGLGRNLMLLSTWYGETALNRRLATSLLRTKCQGMKWDDFDCKT
ncbi:hypothetical protein SUGI_0530720 [Cryptomeria japonica]|nr:hypothetical protein SUGI_0530720 [Cryptomeria japonica]